ncbi:hypothetical protein [Nonomuraea lactucae]|uniref:hypothetical protein n=1 Tax=Nonomuraea lactucae TaxID=2249762 RepID=UPI0013B44973|nr:hypothetical protein [Nonomuraea lactucae]
MDKLDAAEQWLRGCLAGRDGMAQEKHLLEEGAKAGHAANALRQVKERLGADSGELSPGTKWSRWWWLPEATYSAADAKLVGITGNNWPYGPNIDLRSRAQMVAWAKPLGLKLARSTAPLCLKWLEAGRCRGCDSGGLHDEFHIDHMSGWTLNGTPAVIVNHPYDLTGDTIRDLAAAAEIPGLSVSSPGGGWYGNPTVQIEVWNEAVRAQIWRRKTPPVPEEQSRGERQA